MYQAILDQDQDSFDEALHDLEAAEKPIRTPLAIRRAVEQRHPLRSLPKEHRNQFLASLNDVERKAVDAVLDEFENAKTRAIEMLGNYAEVPVGDR
jgi:F420-0:gamma-glutamyl ligase-like protein